MAREMWTLKRIWIYPIKSLPGVEVSESVVTPQGNLQHDREFALVDETGRFMNAKRTADIHRIRARFDLTQWSVSLHSEDHGSPVAFDLDRDAVSMGDWFSDFFRTRLTVIRQSQGGFPDDTEASGPTVISTATLQSVADWFRGLDVPEVRRRFRANLELSGDDPFSEDALFAEAGALVPFRIGAARLFGSNPCQRCAVPTRDTATGEVWPGFQREFASRRQATLPGWANASRFNHFYRLSVNTVVRSAEPQAIQVGDVVGLVQE